jgi:transposase
MADLGLDHGSRPPGCGRGEKKWDGTGGQAEEALGRSRGGFGTKIHGSFSSLGHPVELTLTAAQVHDVTQAHELLADHRPDAVIADKGYDSNEVVETVTARGAEAVIPAKQNRVQPRPHDEHLYKERNIAERFWSKVKHYRRVATRYDKKSANFLAFVHLAAVCVMLQ